MLDRENLEDLVDYEEDDFDDEPEYDTAEEQGIFVDIEPFDDDEWEDEEVYELESYSYVMYGPDDGIARDF